MGGRPSAMKHGELSDRVQRLATWIVNESLLFHNWGYHTLVDEVGDEMPGGRVSDICRLTSGVVVSCKLFGLELFVVVLVSSNRVGPVMSSHERRS